MNDPVSELGQDVPAGSAASLPVPASANGRENIGPRYGRGENPLAAQHEGGHEPEHRRVLVGLG